jgi:hypothetical protein
MNVEHSTFNIELGKEEAGTDTGTLQGSTLNI